MPPHVEETYNFASEAVPKYPGAQALATGDVDPCGQKKPLTAQVTGAEVPPAHQLPVTQGVPVLWSLAEGQ